MAGGVVSNLTYAVGFKVNNKAIKQADAQVESLSDSWGKLGVAALAVGGAITGIGVVAVSAASSFENSMSSIQQATGMTNAQLEETRGIAESLYDQNFGENWDDLSSAIATTAQITGQQGEALEETTKNALLLRDAFGYEVSESIKTTDTLMKQFGISSEEAMNLLAQGTQNGLDKSGELLDTANEYAVHFDALGFSVEDMFDTLAAGSANGAFNLDKVGDAIKEFTIRSKDGSKTTVEAFEMLGLNAEEMMHTFASGGPEAQQSFKDIMSMISDIEDPVQRNTVGVALMGSQFEDLEAQTITAMGTAQEQFDMTKASMDEINEIKFNSPGEAAARIGRQLETNLLIPIGQKLLPYLTEFSEWLETAAPSIKSFGESLVDGIANTIETIGDVVEWIGNNWELFASILGGTIIALIPKFVAWAVSMIPTITTSAALILTWLPFIGIAILIAGAIYGIIMVIQNWGAISQWLGDVWVVVKDFTISVWNSILDFFVSIGNTIASAFNAVVDWIVNAAVSSWNAVSNFTISIFTAIGNFFSNIWNSIATFISTKLDNIFTNISNVWNNITGFLKGINLLDIGKNIMDGLINGIQSKITAVTDMVKNIGSGIKDSISSALGIHSPSRVMMEVGMYTGEGLALGLQDSVYMVEDSSQDLSESTVDSYGDNYENLPQARSENSSSGSINNNINISIDLTGSDGSISEERLAQIVEERIAALFAQQGRRMGFST